MSRGSASSQLTYTWSRRLNPDELTKIIAKELDRELKAGHDSKSRLPIRRNGPCLTLHKLKT